MARWYENTSEIQYSYTKQLAYSANLAPPCHRTSAPPKTKHFSFLLPRNYREVFLSLPPKRTFCLTLLTLAWCCGSTMRRAVVAWSSGSTGGSGGCHRAGTRQTVVVVCLTCSGGTTVVVGPWWRRGTHVVVPAVARPKL